MYHKDAKFSDRHIWANSVDPVQTATGKEQSDQGLHCFLCHLHLLDSLLNGITTLFKF